MVQFRKPPVILDQEAEPEARAAGMRQILGTAALEGASPSREVITWMEEFVRGEKTGDELEAAIRAKYLRNGIGAEQCDVIVEDLGEGHSVAEA